MRGFDLQGLVGAFDEKGVDFIVIGGVAVSAHGFIRATQDLDIVPDPDPENLDRLFDLLVELEATLPTVGGRPFGTDEDRASLRRGSNITTETRLGALDVVQIARGVPKYSELAVDSESAQVGGAPLRVCSLARLRQMKRAQGRAIDLADLENLPDA